MVTEIFRRRFGVNGLLPQDTLQRVAQNRLQLSVFGRELGITLGLIFLNRSNLGTFFSHEWQLGPVLAA